MSIPVITAPAGFVPAHALMFGALNGEAAGVDAGHPLPVTSVVTAATSATLAGTTSASATFGPFVPQIGRPIWASLSGNWTGSAALLRSVDAGSTKLPLTVGGQPWGTFTTNVNEPVIEESDAAATYYLAVTLSAGALTYRVAQ